MVVFVNCLWWVSPPSASSTYDVAFARPCGHTGEKLLYGTTLEKSYHKPPHWRKVKYKPPHWRKVIGNRLFIKNPTNFIHLTLAQGTLGTRPRLLGGNQLLLIFAPVPHRYLPTKVNKNQQKLGSKYESDQCSGSVANDLELFPAVCDLRCSLYKSEDLQ